MARRQVEAPDYTSTLTNAAFSNGVTISGGISYRSSRSNKLHCDGTDDPIRSMRRRNDTLTVGGASGVGTINDDDAAPTISSVTSATQTEGTALVHTVTLSGVSASSTSFAYTIGGGTEATSGTDYGTPTFSNGVTLSAGT